MSVSLGRSLGLGAGRTRPSGARGRGSWRAPSGCSSRIGRRHPGSRVSPRSLPWRCVHGISVGGAAPSCCLCRSQSPRRRRHRRGLGRFCRGRVVTLAVSVSWGGGGRRRTRTRRSGAGKDVHCIGVKVGLYHRWVGRWVELDDEVAQRVEGEVASRQLVVDGREGGGGGDRSFPLRWSNARLSGRRRRPWAMPNRVSSEYHLRFARVERVQRNAGTLSLLNPDAYAFKTFQQRTCQT